MLKTSELSPRIEVKRNRKLKYLLVPYNVACYFTDEHLQKRLEFGDKKKITEFLLDCAGKHLRNGPLIGEEDTIDSHDNSQQTEREMSVPISPPGPSVPVSDFTSSERVWGHSTKIVMGSGSSNTVVKPVDAVLRQIDAYLSLSMEKEFVGKDDDESFSNSLNNI